MNNLLRCPVCHRPLLRDESRYACDQGHSFDLGRQGYVNLLAAHPRRSPSPGDNREMVESRRRFLDKGFYAPISAAINDAAEAHHRGCEDAASYSVLDAGCGEGYYLGRLVSHLSERGCSLHAIGLDISKVAVRYATRRSRHVTWIVAGVVELPVLDSSLDLILSAFAPADYGEFRRALKPSGALFMVIPGSRHLYQLRELLYPEVIPHKPQEALKRASPQFSVASSERLGYMISLESSDDLVDLLRMTPYFWEVPPEARARVSHLNRLALEIDVVLATLRPAGDHFST